jgi:hypothetical protein
LLDVEAVGCGARQESVTADKKDGESDERKKVLHDAARPNCLSPFEIANYTIGTGMQRQVRDLLDER